MVGREGKPRLKLGMFRPGYRPSGQAKAGLKAKAGPSSRGLCSWGVYTVQYPAKSPILYMDFPIKKAYLMALCVFRPNLQARLSAPPMDESLPHGMSDAS